MRDHNRLTHLTDAIENGNEYAVERLEKYAEENAPAKPAATGAAGKAAAGAAPAAAGGVDPDLAQLVLLLSSVVADSRWVDDGDAAAIRKMVYSLKKKLNIK